MQNDLTPALYGELHRLAQRERWRAGRPDTMQTTAILHEAYLRIYRQKDWTSREHFLGTAATAMRHVLTDGARARLAAKRGAGERALPLDTISELNAATKADYDLVRLADALVDLERLDPNLAKLIDCRFFTGLSNEDAGRILGVTDRTVQRWWKQARAWLHSELEMKS